MQEEIGCGGKGYCYGTQVEVHTTMCSCTKRCTWMRHVCWSKFGRNPIVGFCSSYVTMCLSLVPRQSFFLDFACLSMSPELFVCLSIYKIAETCPLRPLSGDSAPLGVIKTAATRGGNGSHSRGEGGPVRKDTSPVKKKNRRTKPSGSRSQVPPMANHGTKLGV